MQVDSHHPTKLAAWLAEAPVKLKDIAARAGMTPEHLRNVADGIRRTTYEKATKLSTATGGVVSVSEIMTDAELVRRARREREEAERRRRERFAREHSK